jgi:hypothetical protein
MVAFNKGLGGSSGTFRLSADGITWTIPLGGPSFINTLFQGPGFVGGLQETSLTTTPKNIVVFTNITPTGFTTTFVPYAPQYATPGNALDGAGYQIAQLGGRYFLPGNGTPDTLNQYATTDDFLSYALRPTGGVSPLWSVVDDSQNPNWQNTNTLN